MAGGCLEGHYLEVKQVVLFVRVMHRVF